MILIHAKLYRNYVVETSQDFLEMNMFTSIPNYTSGAIFVNIGYL